MGEQRWLIARPWKLAHLWVKAAGDDQYRIACGATIRGFDTHEPEVGTDRCPRCTETLEQLHG